MKFYREFTENERESIDDICIEIHKRRLTRNGICVSMHRYDNVGLWFKFDDKPYYCYPETLKRAIQSYEEGIPTECIDTYYEDDYPVYSEQDVFALIEEIQEYESDMVLHNVKQIFYYLYIGDLEIIKTALDDIDYSYQRGIDYDDEIKTLKEIVKEYTS